MRKTGVLFGALALVLLAFSSCGNGTTGGETTKFEGRWLSQAAIQQVAGLTDYSYTFTGNKWAFTSAGSNSDDNWTASGTFEFNDTTISFTVLIGGSGTATRGYTLNGSTLFMTDGGNMPHGDFIKQN